MKFLQNLRVAGSVKAAQLGYQPCSASGYIYSQPKHAEFCLGENWEFFEN